MDNADVMDLNFVSYFLCCNKSFLLKDFPKVHREFTYKYYIIKMIWPKLQYDLLQKVNYTGQSSHFNARSLIIQIISHVGNSTIRKRFIVRQSFTVHDECLTESLLRAISV